MKHTNRIDLVIMTTNETTKKKNNKLNPVATIWSPGGLAQSRRNSTPNNGKTNTTATYWHCPPAGCRAIDPVQRPAANATLHGGVVVKFVVKQRRKVRHSSFWTTKNNNTSILSTLHYSQADEYCVRNRKTQSKVGGNNYTNNNNRINTNNQ